MTKVKAHARWVRIAPRKLDRVAKIIRGMKALAALQMLEFMPQKGALIIKKVIQSAVANAIHNYKLTEDSLIVDQAFVNKGLVMKRWRARARGRVNTIQKKTAHLTVMLESKEAALWVKRYTQRVFV